MVIPGLMSWWPMCLFADAGFSFEEIKNKVTELPGSVASSVGEVTEKCVLQ